MMHCARGLKFTFHPLSSMYKELFVDRFAAYVKHARHLCAWLMIACLHTVP